jgi:secreted trypsin-like serine protease
MTARRPFRRLLAAGLAGAALLAAASGHAQAGCASPTGLIAPGLQPKIINGRPALFKDFPWVATVTRPAASNSTGSEHLCGATWIGGPWLVTAAHCVVGCEPGDLRVFLEGDRYGEAEGAAKLQGPKAISGIFLPDGDMAYGRRAYKGGDGGDGQETKTIAINDVALIKLTEAPALGTPVKILTPPPAPVTGSQTGRVSGFGWVNPSSGTVAQLQSLVVEILPTADCDERFQNNLDNSMICAGRDIAGICDGDSGGGLIVELNGERFLAGIVSWTRFCATNSGGFHADVYANVAHFADWIERTVKEK